MKDTATAIIGFGGVAASKVAEISPMINGADLHGIVATLVQILIGILTIISIFKGKTLIKK